MPERKTYHEIARETSAEVDKILDAYLSDADPHTQLLPRKRMNGNYRLRDVSTRLGYEIAGGKDWNDVVPVAAAFELENCSSYVINWILDKKGEVTSEKERNNFIIAGMQLRELAHQVLVEHGLDKLVSSISDIQQRGYRGQYADLNLLKVENASDFPTLESFLATYEERCTNLSGVFHAHCLFSGSIVADKAELLLYDAGLRFGSALQSTNDIGDFMPPRSDTRTAEKPYSDQFSDLRQGKLTLPVYLLYAHSPEDRVFVEERVGGTWTDYETVVDRLRATGAFDYCYSYLRRKKNELEKHMRTNFSHTQERSNIIQMFAAITSNKFIYALKNKEKELTPQAVPQSSPSAAQSAP
ncbi:MAG TPA: polyprenyl synthetase family protein [Candidatus Binatia bacterium]|nr:polyprenyl synthetase family protein [Candidatus Binatia bacterium]